MVLASFPECQGSALDGMDGKQRGGSYGCAGQSALPPRKRLIGRDCGRVVGNPSLTGLGKVARDSSGVAPVHLAASVF
jgi:hypothetical protein